jgi:hypothetical protein
LTTHDSVSALRCTLPCHSVGVGSVGSTSYKVSELAPAEPAWPVKLSAA